MKWRFSKAIAEIKEDQVVAEIDKPHTCLHHEFALSVDTGLGANVDHSKQKAQRRSGIFFNAFHEVFEKAFLTCGSLQRQNKAL